MYMRVLVILSLVFGQVSCQGATDSLVLVQDGVASSVIVVAADAPAVERQAAMVLRDYVSRITGAELPVVNEAPDAQEVAVVIGRAGTAGAAHGPDGYLLQVSGNRLIIGGGDGKGVLYGVYTLLEKHFGCRKLDQGPAWVPQQTTLQVPGDLVEQADPVLIYRESFYPAAMDNEYLDWHKLHRFEDQWGIWGHSYFKLVPPGDYLKEHPEYFALVGGRRQPTQLCLSNPGVDRVVVAALEERMADMPEAKYWSLAPMDGGGFCTCDACHRADEEEGGHQGSLIRFVNRIAEQFPDKKFTTLAYTYTASPPRKTKPAANVYIMLSSIDAQRHQSLANAASAKAFREQLAGWRALTPNLMVWDYTTQFTNYLAPFPDERYLQPNIAFMADHGVRGIFEQGTGYTYGDLAEYKSYVLAKALWDPAVDMEVVRTDFLQHYYGGAAGAVSDYLDALYSAVVETNAILDIYGNPVNNRVDYLSPERIDRYSVMLDRAEEAAESDPVIAERVGRLRLGMEYTVLQQARLFGRDRHGFLVTDEDRGELAVKGGWRERINRFMQAADRAKVTELAEGGGTPADYAREWDELLKQAWIPGISVDKPVSLAHPFVPDYPAKRAATLTDGMPGSLDYSYNWLLFEQTDLVATVDLGETHRVQEIIVNYLDDPRHYIVAPSEITVEVSSDGQGFTTWGGQQLKVAIDQEMPAQRKTVAIRATGEQSRYVRVTARCSRQFPAGFTGSPSRKPIIAIDEITVR